MARHKVVLPEPLGPMTPINSPSAIVSEMSLSATTPGNPKVAWSNLMIVATAISRGRQRVGRYYSGADPGMNRFPGFRQATGLARSYGHPFRSPAATEVSG